jgi:hypothetical protein
MSPDDRLSPDARSGAGRLVERRPVEPPKTRARGSVRFALDTSVMVAAVCAWHEHHGRAITAIERHLRRSDRLTVAAHAVAEAYAVLTRLPAPHRLATADAWRLVHTNFVAPADVMALDGDGYVALVGRSG